MDERFEPDCPAPPTQAVLDAALGETRRVQVWPGGAIGRADVVLAELEDGAELEALREALQIVEGPAGSCLCTGGPTIELFAGDGRRIASLMVHRRVKLRTALWDGDAPLLDPEAVWRWLDGFGVSEVLARREAELERDLAAMLAD